MARSHFTRALGVAAFVAMLSPSVQAGTLDNVKARGELICGAAGVRAGFSLVDSQGNWQGIDVDTCKAVAAAVLGDANKVKYVKLTVQTRFPALQTGEVDVLACNATMTLTRDTTLGFDFGPVTFYDGQGFMVPKSLNAKSVKDLNGATVCTSPGSTSEKVLADVFRRFNMTYKGVIIEKEQERAQAFFAGRCDVNVQTTSGLASQRAVYAPKPEDFVILPEIYGKDPMGPVVRHGDNQWKDIVSWVVWAMIEAEEVGVTSANVDEQLKSQDPVVRRLLGEIAGNGKALGLDEKWAYRVIKQVGNYAEMYDRSFGAKSALKLDRGINRLWNQGGLMYAPPLQ